jgi:ElaB/YqjD/DUF883 family membrane-anchored ribosome-binding protein
MMMNDKPFENKVKRDVDKVKKDLVTLEDDGVTGLNRVFEHLADDAKKMVDVEVKTLNEAVDHGLSQYNAKVQNVADRIPGGFSKKATEYPWVTITISMAFGLLLGVLLKPGRQLVG